MGSRHMQLIGFIGASSDAGVETKIDDVFTVTTTV